MDKLCPYCKSKIDSKSRICKYCHQEVRLVFLLQKKIKKLESQQLSSDTNQHTISVNQQTVPVNQHTTSIIKKPPLSVNLLFFLAILTITSFILLKSYTYSYNIKLIDAKIYLYQIVIFIAIPILLYFLIIYSKDANLYIIVLFTAIQPLIIPWLDKNVQMSVNMLYSIQYFKWYLGIETLIFGSLIGLTIKKKQQDFFSFSKFATYFKTTGELYDNIVKFFTSIIALLSVINNF